jgi:hypothetical protein
VVEVEIVPVVEIVRVIEIVQVGEDLEVLTRDEPFRPRNPLRREERSVSASSTVGAESGSSATLTVQCQPG